MKASKNIRRYLLGALCIAMMSTACKKNNDNPGSTQTPEKVTPLVRPQGISKGAIVTKQIGVAGGTVQSADQSVTLTIPAGALNATTAVGIEPITNTNIAGMGTAYRLTPHGQSFSKPVSITFSWAAHADSVGLLQTLGLAYQQQDGIWKFVGAHGFDATQKTVTFKTTHFSDWALMNEVSLYPYRADLDPGEKKSITAALFVAKEPDDELFVPLPPGASNTAAEPGYPVGTPITLPVQYVKKWSLAGPGKMTQLATTAVQYEAPASVDNFSTATVTLELKAPDTVTGKYLLVSNINIRGGSWIELSIGGGEPVTFPASPVVHAGNRYLLANPSDEGGGYFMLQWTDGLGIHPFTLATTGTNFHYITTPGNITYVSMYRPSAQTDIIPSGGSVNVTRVSDGRAEGTFNITEVGYGDNLTSKTTTQGRFKVKLVN